MTQKEEKMPEDEYAVLQTKFLMIMVAISITSAIGVFSSSAFLFTNPGVISGIVFQLILRNDLYSYRLERMSFSISVALLPHKVFPISQW